MGLRTRRARLGVLTLPALRILAFGRARGPERALFERYAARTRPAPTLVELADATGSAAERRAREARTLFASLPERALLVALDAGGEALSSEGFAARLGAWLDSGREVAFAIGGAEGFEAVVLARAEAVLSFGPQIWPHMLARVMLAEQIYRARAIAAGHPYHRGRPDAP